MHPTPWTCDDKFELIVDADGRCVLDYGDANMPTDTARRIVAAVNHHASAVDVFPPHVCDDGCGYGHGYGIQFDTN